MACEPSFRAEGFRRLHLTLRPQRGRLTTPLKATSLLPQVLCPQPCPEWRSTLPSCAIPTPVLVQPRSNYLYPTPSSHHPPTPAPPLLRVRPRSQVHRRTRPSRPLVPRGHPPFSSTPYLSPFFRPKGLLPPTSFRLLAYPALAHLPHLATPDLPPASRPLSGLSHRPYPAGRYPTPSYLLHTLCVSLPHHAPHPAPPPCRLGPATYPSPSPPTLSLRFTRPPALPSPSLSLPAIEDNPCSKRWGTSRKGTPFTEW